MTLGTIVLAALVLVLVGALPTWPYSAGWGYAPSGAVGLVLALVIVFLITQRTEPPRVHPRDTSRASAACLAAAEGGFAPCPAER